MELICTKESAEIQKLKAAYRKVTGHDLEDDLASETSGDVEKLLRTLISGQREFGINFDGALAQREAQELYNVNLYFFKLYFKFNPIYNSLIFT